MANKMAAAAAKHTRIRNWFQAAWFALTNGYARGFTSGKIFTGGTKALCLPGLNCYSCPGALASCPIGSLQAVLNSGTYRVSLYVFGLLSMFGVLFGRLVCGWMCPFGLVQDLLYKIKLGPKNKNLPGHKYLRYLRFVVLAVMVIALPALVVNEGGTGQPWFCEWICPSGTLLGGIPLTLLNEEFREIIGFRFFWKMAILVACVLGAIWYYRPFCKYLCPLGAIYGLFNPVSTYRLEIDPNKCIKCRACQRACGMDIATFETPNSMDCIRCGDCVAACPKGAISSTWSQARQQVKSRCFIDDEAVASAAKAQVTSAVESPVKDSMAVTIMGVLMVAGGLASAVMGLVMNLDEDLKTRLNIEALESVEPGSLVFDCLKIIAVLIVFLTGIYVLRHRGDAERLKTVAEKMRVAFLTYVAAVVCLIASIFINLNTITLVINGLINFYPLVGIPLLWGLSAAEKKRLEGNQSKTLMNVMLVLSSIVTISFVVFTVMFILFIATGGE